MNQNEKQPSSTIETDLDKEKLEKFSKLREQTHQAIERETNERIKNNPTPTEEEILVGAFNEMIEPQVRDAVFELHKKGYATESSGFGGEHWQTQSLDGYFEIDDETKQKIEEAGAKVLKGKDLGLPGQEEEYNYIQFNPDNPDINEIKSTWDNIVSLIPSKEQPAPPSISGHSEEFRNQHAADRKDVMDATMQRRTEIEKRDQENRTELSKDDVSQLSQQIREKLDGSGRLRITEAESVALDIAKLAEADNDSFLELASKSPDIVIDMLIRKLDTEKVDELTKDSFDKLSGLITGLQEMEDKFYKNHKPIDFTYANSVVDDLQRSIKILENIGQVDDPSEKTSLLSSIADSIKLANTARLELGRDEEFLKRIAKDIEDKRPYFHVSSIEASRLENDSEFSLYPGTANGWDEGVYVSERPLLHYLGSESGQKKMDTCVIFSLPVDEIFIFNQGSATGEKNDLINANTNKRCVRYKEIIKTKLNREDLERMGAVGLDELDPEVPVYLVTAKEVILDNYTEEEKNKR